MKLRESISSAGASLLVCAAIVIIIAGTKSASDIISPLLMAAFLSIICSAPLYWLKRHGLSNLLSLVIILSAVALIGIAVFGLIANSIDEFSNALPRYRENLGLRYTSLNAFLGQWGFGFPLEWIQQKLNPNALVGFLNYMLSGISSILGNGLVVFLAVLFILTEVSTLPMKIRDTLKDPEQSMVHFEVFVSKVVDYMALKAATSALTAACVAVILWVLDIDYIFLWAILAFFLNFIPYFGSVLAGLPAVVLGYIDHGAFTALWIVLGYLSVNIIVGNVIETKWMGGVLNLSSFVVFVSLIFWGWVFGPTGMFLSIPLTMSITIALESNPQTQAIARLMQNAPKQRA